MRFKDQATFDAPVTLPASTSIGSVTSAEIGYLSGVTQSIQVSLAALLTAISLRALNDSPDLTGNPTAPTQAADNSSTRLATTAFVMGQASTINPVMDGTANPGDGTKWARGNHVHPTDTSRAADNAVVKLTGPQTIAGAKTFSSAIEAPATYTKNEFPASAGLTVESDYATYTGSCEVLRAARAANTAFSFLRNIADYDGTPNTVHLMRGDGQMLVEVNYTSGGADYAEYFEWTDGNVLNEDRRGMTVALEGTKIRPAREGDTIIGAVSANPSVVGDAAWNDWNQKYLRDDYGSYVLDQNGDKVLNPDYDPDREYVPREERPEWDIVGLMGKLRVRRGQPVDDRWIKMRDVSDAVEEWLVR